MLNNAAKLLTVKLDKKETLEKEWALQLQRFEKPFYESFGYRLQMSFDFLTPYFKNIVDEIIKEAQVISESFSVFYHDYKTLQTKVEYTSRIHKDTLRKAAITIPIFTQDPLLFYDYDDQLDTNVRKKEIKKPNQILQYEYDHPTLINTSNLHSVYVMDEKYSRALIQINCLDTFEEIINKNKEKFCLL